MNNKIFLKKAISLLLCMAMVLTYLPLSMLTVAGASQPLNIVSGSKLVDVSTMDGWKQYFGPDKMDTEFTGAVWTDISLFSGPTSDLPGITMINPDNFLVVMSAIAANLSITGHTSAPTDTMLVLDVSGSMVDDTYEVGTIRENYFNYETVNGIDMSLIEAMIDATNATIDQLMKQNSNNRVGVVLYSGNTNSNQAANSNSATVVLPLDRYTGINGRYLSVDAEYVTEQLYEYRNWRWQATGQNATYVPSGSDIKVSVLDNLKKESGGAVDNAEKTVVGGTYIQNGLYKAMQQFLAVTDTVVPEGRPQAGAERLPVIVLMTDGAPTVATTSYTNVESSNTGDGRETNDRITFLTQLTAAYVRGSVAAHYREDNNDNNDVLFLTLGLGTENSSQATNTLYPLGSNNNLRTYWNRYLAAGDGESVTAITGNNSLTVTRENEVAAMNYVDTYYYASNAEGLINSFSQIVSEIQLKAETYTTLVEGSNADFSGYVSFEDKLGDLMSVHNIKGILIGDTLYSGIELAKGMTDDNLGTIASPYDSGDELVATVKERIPGTDTTLAQQLITNAYNDQQLYYVDDDNWSNYIGWYSDANGNYVGFWDKDSGYENAPEGAAYVNMSYGFLGENRNSDMMHVVVMVRTDLTTLNQTVHFRIPASLLPTVKYKVTLDENNLSKVDEFVREGADPMRLVYEVGVRPDINSVNLEQKIAEHLEKGGKIDRNEDGSVNLYVNDYDFINDNKNYVPTEDELDTSIVPDSHFHPAYDNNRFYYTDNAIIITSNGNPVTSTVRPTDTDNDPTNGTGYYYVRYIYTPDGRIEKNTPIAATTLKNDAKYDSENGYWYVPAGTMYHDLERFMNEKDPRVTDTLSYSFYPSAFDNDTKQDVYAFLGNNGTLKIAPATGITLRKQIQGTIDAEKYTFKITLSDIPANAEVAPVLTDANGDTLASVVMSDYANGQFTVTMPANVTAYISGIPVGTNVLVAELIDGDYRVVDIQVAGQQQSIDGPASVTIPAYSANGTQMVPVIITNAANSYGNLIISKDIVHKLASDPAAMATKEFTFNVKLTGNNINDGSSFYTSEDTYVFVDADGNLIFENGNKITLSNEESITIYHIPEGTVYTITEETLPGFVLESINGNEDAAVATGSIPGNSNATVAFVNRYSNEPISINVDVDVTKVLNEISEYNGDEKFVFVLQMLLPDNTYPSIAATNGNKYLEVGAGETKSQAFTLEFDTIGTYFFRIVELRPSDPELAGTDTPGMSYSTMRALFQINVTDNDMDGILEVSVREEANVTATPEYADEDTEKIEKISVAATFTNIYEVNSISTILNVHKTLVNNTGAIKPLTDFHFLLHPSDASGNVADDATPTRVTTSALGDATFNILLESAGTHYFVVAEEIPTDAKYNSETGKYELNGMSYDSTRYLYTVVTEATGEGSEATLEITEESLVNLTADPNETIEADSNGKYTAQFKNEYNLTSTGVNITLSKDLIGRDRIGDEGYPTYIVRTNGAFITLTGDDAWNSTYTVGANRSIVVPLTFDKVGTYHYKWTEIVPENATLDSITGKYVLNGVSYDNTEYHVTITVSDNGAGGMNAQTVIHKVGTVAPVDEVKFENVYTVTGSDSVVLSGTKTLNGRRFVAGEFEFGLYSNVECTNLIDSTTNLANGSYFFNLGPYTVDDLGENYANKTYTYYVKEIVPDGAVLNSETDMYELNGVSYDPSVYTVTVTVGHENGLLTVTASDNADNLDFENIYVAKATDAVIPGSKLLIGDWTKKIDLLDTFTFELYETGEAFTLDQEQEPLQTTTVSGNLADYLNNGVPFTFTLEYKDGDEGFHYYVMKEDASDNSAGVGYDAGEYHITINVSDPGNGQLIAMMTIYRPGTGNTDEAVFSNAYNVTPTDITLSGHKDYINYVTEEPMDMTDITFDFLVLEEGNDGYDIVSTGINDDEGNITFSKITYYQPGVHTYVVVEAAGDAGGVIYDDTKFTVTVTVVDNGDGTLTATVVYDDGEIEFLNFYNHESAQVILNGEKFLEGDWDAVAEANKQFTFELYETDESFTISGEPVDTVISSEGEFTFGAKSFNVEGTYYLVVVERSGDSDKGITYDDTLYYITVFVNDDGNGNLIPEILVTDINLSVTYDETNYRNVTIDNLNFTNKYETSATEYKPEALKEYKGDSIKEFDFILSLNGDEIQKVQNDSEGNISFDAVTLNTVGIYTFEIREEHNILWGLIRWDTNVYTITVHVEDNGLGQLIVNDSKTVITSVKGDDDLTFTNVHHNIITNKDVTTVTDPEVSINDMKVELGDVLMYHITYTNYDTVPVDVVITDTIPEFTTFVDGSADNNGILVGDTVRWTINGIAPKTSVTVTFQVEVTGAKDDIIVNQATVVEGDNEYTTNEVNNPIEEDTITKDVFAAIAPTISIDNKTVAEGDLLLYQITYTNTDDFTADVTITDSIPQYTTYVDGSADNNGTYADGMITWNVVLEAGESITVSFQVKVVDNNVSIVNQASALEGDARVISNKVTNYVPETIEVEQTGDDMQLVMWTIMMLASIVCMFTMFIFKKRYVR